MIKNKLDTFPTAWSELSDNEKVLMSETLRPFNGFSEEQYSLLKNRYLPVNENLINEINNTLPSTIKVPAKKDKEGNLWVTASLLTDCMRQGDTYFLIASIISNLPITLLEESVFDTIIE